MQVSRQTRYLLMLLVGTFRNGSKIIERQKSNTMHDTPRGKKRYKRGLHPQERFIMLCQSSLEAKFLTKNGTTEVADGHKHGTRGSSRPASILSCKMTQAASRRPSFKRPVFHPTLHWFLNRNNAIPRHGFEILPVTAVPALLEPKRSVGTKRFVGLSTFQADTLTH